MTPSKQKTPSLFHAIDWRSLALIGAVTLVIVIFSLIAPGFRSPMNVSAIAQILSYTTIAALGLYLIILLGHIDLSIGSAMALSASISCLLVQQSWPAPAAMGVALVCTVTAYAGMGFLVAWLRLPAFIVTLGGLLAFRGLSERLIGMRSVPSKLSGQENALSILTDYRLPTWLSISLVGALGTSMLAAMLYERQARKRYELQRRPLIIDLAGPIVTIFLSAVMVYILEQDLGVPLCLPLLGIVGFVMWFLAMRTRFGRWCFAIGGNVEAARLSGIPVKATTLGAFIIAGILAALGGFLVAAYGGSANPTTANLMELDAIAACVIGGVSLMGGRGMVSRVFLGALLIVCLVKGMDFLNLEPYDKKIVRGTVLVLAVWLDMHLQRSRGGLRAAA